MTKKRLIIILIILAFVGLTTFRLVQYSRKKKAEKSVSEAPTRVKIAIVKRGVIRETISLTGDVYGQQEVNIFARVPGKLIKKIKKEGDYIKKDQTIALIDRDEPGMDFTESEVKATISGIVINIYPDLNDAVFPAQGMTSKPVATVANMNKVKVISYLSEKDIGKVKEGQEVKLFVDAYPDKIFWGKLKKVAPAVDPVIRKLKVEAIIPNPEHKLKSGMFAHLEIVISMQKNALVVPLIAVLGKEDEEKHVFVVEDNKAKKVIVEAGLTEEKFIEIKKGLKEGQRVIIEGNYGLPDGTDIEIVKKEQS